MLVVTSCFATNAKDPKTIVAQVVDAMVGEDFDAVVDTFDDNMKSKLPSAQLKAAWKQVQGAVGDYSKTSPPKEIAKGTFESTVSFSRLALIVRVSVDSNDKVAGLFMRPAPLPKPKVDSKPTNEFERDLTFEINGVSIHGTLLLPTTKRETMPLAVLHAGSGPTDRDGNQPLLPNDSLKKLAEELTEKGIATFRYDKRGSGETGIAGAESDLKLQTYADDLTGVVAKLKSLSDVSFETITLVGHSEGAQICMLSTKKADVDRVVTVAGSGRNFKELLESQLKGKLPPDLTKTSNEILEELASGRLVDNVPESLQMLFRPSVQPFLISCIESDPEDLAASLKVPMLIVQGDKDIQVGVEDAQRLLKAQPKAELQVFEGMNHVLRIVTNDDEQQASYRDPKLDLAPGLSKRIAAFIEPNPQDD